MRLRRLRPIRSARWLVPAVLGALILLIDLLCVETGVTTGADRSFDHSLHATFGSHSYRLFELMSAAGAGPARLLMIGLVVLALLIGRYLWSATLALIACGGASLLDTLTKIQVGRARPQLFPHAVSAAGSSFPSGHAVDVSSLAVLIVYIVWHLSGRPNLTIAAGVLLGVFALLVGLSRIVLGVHYPTDVIGGYALGAGWTALCIAALASALETERATTVG